MKRITAVLIASAAILGCSYVGGANAASLPDCDAIAATYFSKYYDDGHAGIRDHIIDEDAEICVMGATFKKNGATEAEAEDILKKIRAEGIAKAVTERQKLELIETINRKSEVFMAGYRGYSK